MVVGLPFRGLAIFREEALSAVFDFTGAPVLSKSFVEVRVEASNPRLRLRPRLDRRPRSAAVGCDVQAPKAPIPTSGCGGRGRG